MVDGSKTLNEKIRILKKQILYDLKGKAWPTKWYVDNKYWWRDHRPDMFWDLRLIMFLKKPICWIIGHKQPDYIDYCFRCGKSNFSKDLCKFWHNKPEDFIHGVRYVK